MSLKSINVRAAASILLVAAACAAPRVKESPVNESIQEGLLVQGGTLVLRGRDTTVTTILIQRGLDGWTVHYDPETGVVTQDTLQASGLYFHSAHAFDPGEPRSGSSPMFVVRTGPSPGDQAVMRIDPDALPAVRRLLQEDTHPPGAIDPAVGCYDLEMGTVTAANQISEVLGAGLRLHWQYLLFYGRDRVLAATDRLGRVPGQRTTLASWAPAGDSVVVMFRQPPHDGVALRLERRRSDLVGAATMIRYPDWEIVSVHLLGSPCDA